jgi:hypothetical protein
VATIIVAIVASASSLASYLIARAERRRMQEMAVRHAA